MTRLIRISLPVALLMLPLHAAQAIVVLPPPPINPFFTVRPQIFPLGTAPSRMVLIVRDTNSSNGVLNTNDDFGFSIASPSMKIVFTDPEPAVTLMIGSTSTLVPGDFAISFTGIGSINNPPPATNLHITYVNPTAKALAPGEMIVLEVSVQLVSPPAVPSAVATLSYESANANNGAATPAAPDLLAFVDFATGPAGPQGAIGPQGPIGVAGPQGSAGAQGATGPVGPAGAQGVAGPVGSSGPAGAAGQSVVGSSEPPGPNCTTGGEKYVSASGTAFVCNGATGAAGATGPVGPVGLAGPAGATGPAGPQGLAGANGAIGPQGLAGANGALGPQGPAGPQGEVGPAGAAGEAGANAKGGGCSTAPHDVQPAFVVLLASLPFLLRKRPRRVPLRPRP
jgi:hypothetical protein